MNVAEFIAAHGLTMEVEPITARTDITADDWHKEASHWRVTIKHGNGRAVTLEYSRGAAHRRWRSDALRRAWGWNLIPSELADIQPGENLQQNYLRRTIHLDRMREELSEPIPPPIAEVLDCLASDAAGVDGARSFEEWAVEYGMDADSRKAEKSYRLTLDQSRALRVMLGNGPYDDLLYQVDRQ